MGTKSVRLDEDVYEQVKAKKEPEETFSEAVGRLIGGYSLLDFAEDAAVDEEEADELRKYIEEANEAYHESVEDLVGSAE
jgi:predicted CopG family antitoxin